MRTLNSSIDSNIMFSDENQFRVQKVLPALTTGAWYATGAATAWDTTAGAAYACAYGAAYEAYGAAYGAA